MKNTQSISNTSQALIEPLKPTYNRYATINLLEQGTYDRRVEKLYQVAAVTAMVAGVAILGAGIAASAFFTAPITVTISVVLIGLVILKYGVHGTIYEHLKNKSIEARQSAEEHEEYGKYLSLVKQQFPQKQEHIAQLTAMYRYWSATAESAKTKIDALDKTIQQVESQFENNPTDELDLLHTKYLKEKNDLFEGVYLPAKLNAAYFFYLVGNPTDERDSTDFGESQPRSLFSTLKANASHIETPYFVFKNKPNPLSRQYLAETKIADLSSRIFRDKKAA